MKIKQINVLMILVLMLTLFSFAPSQVMADNQRVYDQAELFSEAQKEALQQRISELTGQLQLDIVIVTTNHTDGKTSRDYADDFYDENGFGFGEEYDGLLLLINMQDREVYISTCGKAIEYFTDARIEAVLDEIYHHLPGGNYSEGSFAFLNEVERYVRAGVPEGQYTVHEKDLAKQPKQPKQPKQKQQTTTEDFINLLKFSFFVSVAIGAISVLVMAFNNRGRPSVDRDTYLQGFKLTLSEDKYYNTRVTKTKIPKNTGSGGGSSGGMSTTHTSSSGRTHGGGGRSF